MNAPVTRDMGRLVADNVPAMLAYLDAEFRIRFVNRQSFPLLGYAPAELVGRPLADVVDPATMKHARAHAAALERGHREPCEYVLRHKQGAKRYLKVHAVARRDAHGRSIGFYACTSDYSAEKIARYAQWRASGHELRTPLASVIAALELVREGTCPEAACACGPFVGIALVNADRLAQAIEQVLRFDGIVPVPEEE